MAGKSDVASDVSLQCGGGRRVGHSNSLGRRSADVREGRRHLCCGDRKLAV